MGGAAQVSKLQQRQRRAAVATRWWRRLVRSMAVMLEVSEEKPDGMTKTAQTMAFPRRRRWRCAYHTKSTRRDGRVDRAPMCYDLRGRRSGITRVGAAAGKPQGGGIDRVPRCYGPKGRRNGGAWVGVATGTAPGGAGDRVPPRYSLKGWSSGVSWVGAGARRTTRWRRCGPTGRHNDSPMLDR